MKLAFPTDLYSRETGTKLRQIIVVRKLPHPTKADEFLFQDSAGDWFVRRGGLGVFEAEASEVPTGAQVEAAEKAEGVED